MIYVITFVVFAAILFLAFRAMGGEPVDLAGAADFTHKVRGWVVAEVDRLAALDGGGRPAAGLEEHARSARKALSGYQMQLTRLDVEDPEGTTKAAIESVSVAITELGWACRMLESGDAARDVTIADAARSLYRSARGRLGLGAAVATTPQRAGAIASRK